MAIRKAGDSMLQAAYRDILKSRGYQAVVDGDSAPLIERLQADGSVLMAPQEMRETLADLKGRRVVEALQSASPARRIQALTEAIQDAAPDGAPMVFPVADAKGIYGASVIDGDRLVAHELANHGDGILENMVFVPTANNALTHVAAVGEGYGDPLVYGTLSQQTARRLYGAAKGKGYVPGSHGIFDEWDYSGGITPLGSQADPYLGDLLSQVRQRAAAQPAPPQRPVYRMPMYFSYDGQSLPGTAPTTFDAILKGQRTSTLRRLGQTPESVTPGSVIEVWDKQGRAQPVVVTGRRVVDPSMVEELAQTERWTPQFLDRYIRGYGGGQMEQILYRLP